LAFRNLFQNKTRLVISVGGVSLALLLILSLDAIFNGVEQQITAYINNSGADIFVSQSSVQNMHMASSSLPVSLTEKVMDIPGVQAVTPILYLPNMVVIGDERNLAYIIGLPEDALMGGAWQVSSGSAQPRRGEAIIDHNVGEKSNVGLGDEVEILGHKFKITGLSEGTASLVNSIAFISLADFAALRGSPDTISFLLIRVEPGSDPTDVAKHIEEEVNGVTVQTREAFAAQESRVVKDMSIDVITIMNMIGFFIGLAVMSLTVYTSILSRRNEFGVLKAIGARNAHLYRAVLGHAAFSVILGFGVGLGLTLLLSAVIPRLGLNLALVVSWEALLKVGGISVVIASLSALLPIRQIAGLDPAMVFRGK
jgi:putative ABC transport system permease protein